LTPRGWAFSPTGFVRRVFAGAYEDNIPFLASALTFDALLWILPFFLVALAIFGFAVDPQGQTIADVGMLFERLLPVSTAGDPFTAVEDFIVRVVDSRVALSLYGLPLFLWLSLRLFGSVRVALNEVFDTEETRPWFVAKGRDFLLALVSAILLSANTLVTVLVLESPWFGRFLAQLSAFLFAVLLAFVVYRVAPSRVVRWDTALVAAVATSLAFEVAKRFFAIYLAQFATFDRLISNTNAIAVLLFVLWIYYTAFVFLAGGELAETYDLARRQREQRALLS
jgi:membrane protein